MKDPVTAALLEKLRVRPGICLGYPDLTRLYFLLSGYELRERELHPDGPVDGFWRGFNDYIADYYGIHTSHGWCQIIEFFTNGPEDAFDTFFQRYDEYLAAYREGKTPPPRFRF